MDQAGEHDFFDDFNNDQLFEQGKSTIILILFYFGLFSSIIGHGDIDNEDDDDDVDEDEAEEENTSCHEDISSAQVKSESSLNSNVMPLAVSHSTPNSNTIRSNPNHNYPPRSITTDLANCDGAVSNTLNYNSQYYNNLNYNSQYYNNLNYNGQNEDQY